MSSYASRLKKLKIIAYSDIERREEIGSFEAMFNPESIQQRSSVNYSKEQGINTSDQTQKYNFSPPTDISFKLLLSSAGPMSQEFIKKRTSVAAEVKRLQKLAYSYNGDIHEPNYLTINWGEFKYNCRLQNLNINYSVFDSKGNPVNVELDCSFVSDESVTTLFKKENKNSPDMTHARVIDPANTLTLIAKEVYGDPSYYLALARFNNLDHFRDIPYGKKITCPPLEQLL